MRSSCLSFRGAWAFLIAVPLALAPSSLNAEEPAVAPSSTDRSVSVPAEILAVRDALVAAEVAGRVLERPEDEAAAVLAGEIVVRLDDATHAAQQRVARAAHRSAEAALDWARLDHERVKQLFESGSIGAAEYDRVRIGLRQAEAGVEEATAVAQAAELLVERTRMPAPFSGRLVRIFPEVGEYLRPGEPAFRLVDDTALRIVAYVPAEWLSELKVGGGIRVAPDSGTDRSVSSRAPAPLLTATITSVAFAAEGKARTFRVEARAPLSADERWRPGATGLFLRPAGGAAKDGTGPKED